MGRAHRISLCREMCSLARLQIGSTGHAMWCRPDGLTKCTASEAHPRCDASAKVKPDATGTGWPTLVDRFVRWGSAGRRISISGVKTSASTLYMRKCPSESSTATCDSESGCHSACANEAIGEKTMLDATAASTEVAARLHDEDFFSSEQCRTLARLSPARRAL